MRHPKWCRIFYKSLIINNIKIYKKKVSKSGEGLRHKMILVCGGPRITHELAKELGYDAGFGINSYADDVASYIAQQVVEREKN